ncbi:hypothetical protein VNI00_011261 [Paramarasmius palmivorus]|uniref:Uncharacterized protein n=1 Tax=Paramarasmius palmivorus TaxID=297713 RepID=A0AAW0CBS0_9AGAR
MIQIDHGSTLNSVGRDQINRIVQHITTQVVQPKNEVAMATEIPEDAEYAEFHTVKRGDMYILKTIGSEEITEWEWDEELRTIRVGMRAQQTISTVKLRGVKCTALSYDGQDAHKLWRRDFLRFARNQDETRGQLFGINRSKIPSLLLHHGTVSPHPKLDTLTGAFITRTYTGQTLCSEHARNSRNECGNILFMYLDTETGRFCQDPTRTTDSIPFRHASNYTMSDLDSYKFKLDSITPSAMNMLDRSFAMAFFQDQGSHFDRPVVYHAYHVYKRHSNSPPPTTSKEHPLGWNQGLSPADARFDTIYSRSGAEIARIPNYKARFTFNHHTITSLSTMEESGMMRFTMNPSSPGKYKGEISVDSTVLGKAWLLQAYSICSNLPASNNVPEHCSMFDLSNEDEQKLILYLTVLPVIADNPIIMSYKGVQRQYRRPFYLFLSPLPCPLSHNSLNAWKRGKTHFWSLDRAGEIAIPEEELESQLGLSDVRIVPYIPGRFDTVMWQSFVYEALREWQIARGFDPTTADFAKLLGYPKLENLGKILADASTLSGH